MKEQCKITKRRRDGMWILTRKGSTAPGKAEIASKEKTRLVNIAFLRGWEIVSKWS